MIIDECPHCQTRHVQTTNRFGDPLKEGEPETWFIERCQNPDCQRLILIGRDAQNVDSIKYPLGSYDIDKKIKIGDAIRDEFKEAGQCLLADCPKASMVMSRRVLQRILKEQGAGQKKLVNAIGHAKEKGILRKSFHKLADEIREYGNLSAHPDDDQLKNANKDSAKQILDFVELLIEEFYEVPAAAEALRAQRETEEKTEAAAGEDNGDNTTASD